MSNKMTVRQHIVSMNLRQRAERLTRLEELGAPAFIIAHEKELAEAWQSGTVQVRGDETLLNTEVVIMVKRKGRGGKEYFVFNDTIAYFPRARFGRYVTLLGDHWKPPPPQQ